MLSRQLAEYLTQFSPMFHFYTPLISIPRFHGEWKWNIELKWVNFSLDKICENTSFHKPIFSRNSPKIVDFVLIQENMGQSKPVFSHILCSVSAKIMKTIFQFLTSHEKRNCSVINPRKKLRFSTLQKLHQDKNYSISCFLLFRECREIARMPKELNIANIRKNCIW